MRNPAIRIGPRRNLMKLIRKLKLLFTPGYIKSGIIGDTGSKETAYSGETRLSRSLKQAVRDEGIPIKLLPNVRSFVVKIKDLDWLFEIFGLERRLKPEFRFEPWRNRKINRHVVWQFKRLGRARNNPRLFFRIA